MRSGDMCIVDGGPAPPAPDSIWHWLKLGVDIDPLAPALQAPSVSADHLSNLLVAPKSDTEADIFTWSYAQLEEAAHTLAAHLLSRGVGPEDVVVTFLPNSVEWAVFFWATIQLRASFVPLDLDLMSKPDELKYLIEVSKSTVIIANDAQAAAQIDRTAKESQDAWKMRMICNMDRAAAHGWEHLRHVTCDRSATEYLRSRLKESSETDSVSVAVLMFTSGTTSQPKGCPIPSPAFVASCDGYRAGQLGKWDNSTRFLATSKNFYATCWLGSFTTWRSGGCVVLMPQRSEPRTRAIQPILAAICAHKIIHLFMDTFDVQAMIKDPSLREHQPCSLRWVNITGDIVNKTLLNMCKQKLRAENVVSIWGMTEGAPITNWTSTHDVIPYTTPEEGEIVGLGRILPGAKAKICYEDTHDPVEWGQTGDLHVCAVNFITSYLNGQNSEAFYQDENGCTWLVTGDRARICRDGVMYLMGREKDIIKGIEIVVIPGVLEALLRKQEWVEQCHVVGVPYPDSGDVPVAIVVRRERYTTPPIQDVNNVIEAQLESQYVLNAVYSLTELGFDAWPVNATGKILKRILKEAVARKRNQEECAAKQL